jgi:hypothetical protein
MPSSKEAVVNRALSGDELKKLILADATRLLDNEGLLSPHIAFGRVGYTLTLRLHVDNPFIPDTTITSNTRLNKAIPVIEPAPLTAPSSESEVGAMELTRTITSPNAERLRESMPVPVLVRGQDGTTTTESIIYPKDSFPELGPGEMMIQDATEMTRQAWQLVEGDHVSQVKE